jgi:ADP-heptose:LPS heptosyltransferase
MFVNNTRLDKLYPINEFNNNRQKYHAVIMLDNAYERDTKELCYRAYYKVAGIEDEDIAWPELYFSKEELQSADDILATHKIAHGNGPIAVFHTGMTNWLGRNLELEKFEVIAKYLNDKGWSIIEVGGKDTGKMDVESTKLQGENVPVRTSMAVIGKVNLFVGIDSFPWNVAQTCKVPAVVVFGCVDPKTRILDNKLTTAVYSGDKICLGCHHEFRGPVHESQCMRRREGNRKTYCAPCMEDISVGQLLGAVEKTIRENTVMSETAKIRDKVVEYIKSIEHGIDIGCGPDKLYPTSVGFDKYKTMVVDIVGDARSLQFKDGEFDYVFSSHCLEDFIDKPSVLREWCRTVKVGGKIALYLPHKDYYKGCNMDHYELFDSNYIKPLLEALGFTIELDYLDIGDYNGVKDDRYSFLVIATRNG